MTKSTSRPARATAAPDSPATSSNIGFRPAKVHAPRSSFPTDPRMDEARQRLPEVLDHYGIEWRERGSFRCHFHEDHNPSANLFTGRDGTPRYKCHGCGISLDSFGVVAEKEGLDISADFPEVKRITFALLNASDTPTATPKAKPVPAPSTPSTVAAVLPPADLAPTISDAVLAAAEALEQSDFGKAYLAKRGISLDTARRFNIGFVVGPKCFPHRPCLSIPTSGGSVNYRNIESKDKNDRYRNEGEKRPFNLAALDADASQTVFIVEGELDAATIEQSGFRAVGLSSASVAAGFADIAKIRMPKCRLAILMDQDKAGEDAKLVLEVNLRGSGVRYIIAPPIPGAHDANELLVKDPEALRQYLAGVAATPDTAETEPEEPKEDYQRGAAAFLVDAFEEYSHDLTRKVYPTGFPKLDEALNGGFVAGLIVMGGESTVGKTSLAAQIADTLAAMGFDVLIVSLEQGRFEIIAKSVARIAYQLAEPEERSLAPTAADLLTPPRRCALGATAERLVAVAETRYRETAKRIYLEEWDGTGDYTAEGIRTRVQRHIERTGNKPVVLVDYLQIMPPSEGTERGTDKQQTDHKVLSLRRTARDLGVPIVAISSFNRGAYGGPVEMGAFKESGSIEYSADVVLGIQPKGMDGNAKFDYKAWKQTLPLAEEITILKQRNGKSRVSVPVDFDPIHGVFVEAEETEEDGAENTRRDRVEHIGALVREGNGEWIEQPAIISKLCETWGISEDAARRDVDAFRAHLPDDIGKAQGGKNNAVRFRSLHRGGRSHD